MKVENRNTVSRSKRLVTGTWGNRFDPNHGYFSDNINIYRVNLTNLNVTAAKLDGGLDGEELLSVGYDARTKNQYWGTESGKMFRFDIEREYA